MEKADFFERPVVIVSCPRAGSTLLFETLAKHENLWTVGGESHFIIESFPELRPDARDFDSHCLAAEDLDADLAASLRRLFKENLRNSVGQLFTKLPAAERPEKVRFLEKTPRNALRISFLDALFPDARYIFLYRDPRQNLASIIEAWEAPGFWQFRGDLPGWDRPEWCMLLPPGWRNLVGSSLAEIAAFQWVESNRLAWADLSRIPRERFLMLNFSDFLASPGHHLKRISRFAGIDGFEVDRLQHSSSVVSLPDHEKWKKREKEILRVLPEAWNLYEEFKQAEPSF